jgi:hypothetical protein
MLVRLSEREIRMAAGNAVERRMDRLRSGQGERYEPAGARGLGSDFIGCLGELAVAKFLGRYPLGFVEPGSPDVAGVEVRTIDRAGAALQVYPSDDAAAACVLACVGDVFREGVRLIGWIECRAAQDVRFWSDSYARGVFLVPQLALRPVGELPGFLSKGVVHG